MNFSDALKALKDGKKIRRKKWSAESFIFLDKFLDKDEIELYYCYDLDGIKIIPTEIDAEGLLAEDWEIVGA